MYCSFLLIPSTLIKLPGYFAIKYHQIIKLPLLWFTTGTMFFGKTCSTSIWPNNCIFVTLNHIFSQFHITSQYDFQQTSKCLHIGKSLKGQHGFNGPVSNIIPTVQLETFSPTSSNSSVISFVVILGLFCENHAIQRFPLSEKIFIYTHFHDRAPLFKFSITTHTIDLERLYLLSILL